MSSREEGIPTEGTAFGEDLKQEEAGTREMDRAIQCC